jgi:nucleoside-diphosphate kinase
LFAVGRNIIHGSDGKDSAAHEISFWFKDDELVEWNPSLASWIYE